MSVTLKDIRQTLSRKLGGFDSGTVSLSPDNTDSLAQRSILSSKLYDADRGNKGFAGHFAWVGRYRDERRVRENGYRSLPYVVYTPPSSGTYTITVYGYGETGDIEFDATNQEISDALQLIGQGLGTLTVSGGGADPILIALPDIIDVEVSAGDVLASGGIGAIEVNRAFTRALQVGDAWETHAKLPVEDSDEVQGLNWIINYAARKLTIIDKFPITPVRNSGGVKNFIGLTGESWLSDKRQIIAVYQPTEWVSTTTLTPPDSGTYTLTFDIATETLTTEAIDYDATGEEIQDALEDALEGFTVTVTPQDASESFVIAIEKTWYAQATLSASSGTTSSTTGMFRSPSIYPNTWDFSYDAESPYMDNIYGKEGRSFLIEAYRQANTWVCPQASYGVLGSMWQSSEIGMVDDYDQISVSLDDIVAVAYAYACEQLSHVGPGTDRGVWADEAKKAHRVAAGIKMYDMPIQDKPHGSHRAYNSAQARGFF